MTSFAPLLLAFAALMGAGAVLSTQSPINAALARGLGDPALATCANFLVGFLIMAVICAFRGIWPAAGAVGEVPVWAWTGGAMGVFYITVLILCVPVAGALTATAAVIFGQMAMALLVDRIGAFGLPIQEITWPRLGGLVLVMAGLLLSRL